MPRNKDNPPCPACGSSATLPFENEENPGNKETFSEIILTIFLLFLAMFCLFLILLLSHAGLPIALFILLVILLYWRRKKESRHSRMRPQQFICLDCSRNFKA